MNIFSNYCQYIYSNFKSKVCHGLEFGYLTSPRHIQWLLFLSFCPHNFTLCTSHVLCSRICCCLLCHAHTQSSPQASWNGLPGCPVKLKNENWSEQNIACYICNISLQSTNYISSPKHIKHNKIFLLTSCSYFLCDYMYLISFFLTCITSTSMYFHCGIMVNHSQ